MSKVLVLPDVHGREFWKKPCENIDNFDKVVFLGDYLDPYDFDGITVKMAIENFKQIIDFVKKNTDKVVLLLGNHDMPYFSDTYYGLSWWHCRHSKEHHKEISDLFSSYNDFRIAFSFDDVLFTHAGCTSWWLSKWFDKKFDKELNLDELCSELNNTLCTEEGLKKLYRIGPERGGRDNFSSCIWADVNESIDNAYANEAFDDFDDETKEFAKDSICAIHSVKQVFGHTIQVSARYSTERFGGIIYTYGEPYEYGNLKMLDTANAYILDTVEFTAEKLNND